MIFSFDPLSPKERSERMGRVKAVNTKIELTVRHLVWSLGYRYRLHGKKLPGSPDLVFRRRKKVLFVHGCFWHQHENCRQYRMPKTRLDFWLPKLEGNKARDTKNQDLLRKEGWEVMIVWECELKKEAELASRIVNFLEGR